jgi:hypothetical protein
VIHPIPLTVADSHSAQRVGLGKCRGTVWIGLCTQPYVVGGSSDVCLIDYLLCHFSPDSTQSSEET